VAGIAHFVEHMLFRARTTRSAEDIAQTVDSVGGQMDASTGKENANYAIKVLDEHLTLAVDVLSDVVLHPRFAAGDIEREKGVVGEEIKMVEDMPTTSSTSCSSSGSGAAIHWAGPSSARPTA